MYLRVRGRYQEIWESYRHEVTGKPTSRCVYRWPVGRSLDDEFRAVNGAWSTQMLRTAREGGRKNRYQLLKLELRALQYSRARHGLEKLPPNEEAAAREQELRLELASLSTAGC